MNKKNEKVEKKTEPAKSEAKRSSSFKKKKKIKKISHLELHTFIRLLIIL